MTDDEARKIVRAADQAAHAFVERICAKWEAEGRVARARSRQILLPVANPYREGTAAAASWQRGYMAAMSD